MLWCIGLGVIISFHYPYIMSVLLFENFSFTCTCIRAHVHMYITYLSETRGTPELEGAQQDVGEEVL